MNALVAAYVEKCGALKDRTPALMAELMSLWDAMTPEQQDAAEEILNPKLMAERRWVAQRIAEGWK